MLNLEEARLPPAHMDLVRRMLQKYPSARIRAEEALRHALLADVTQPLRGLPALAPRSVSQFEPEMDALTLGKQRMSCIVRDNFFEVPSEPQKRTSILCLRDVNAGSGTPFNPAVWQNPIENKPLVTQQPVNPSPVMGRQLSVCEFRDHPRTVLGEVILTENRAPNRPPLRQDFEKASFVRAPSSMPLLQQAPVKPERRPVLHRVTIDGPATAPLKIY